MNKIILAVSALIASLALFIGLLSVTLDETEKTLGAFDAGLIATTTSRFYSHAATGTRTATSTLQRLVVENEVVEIGMILTGESATNTPGTIYVQPEGAYDTNYGYATLANLYTVTGAEGAAVNTIALGTGTTTFTLVPSGNGTTSVAYSFKPPAGIREMRFLVWSTGTSSIALDVYKLLK